MIKGILIDIKRDNCNVRYLLLLLLSSDRTSIKGRLLEMQQLISY